MPNTNPEVLNQRGLNLLARYSLLRHEDPADFQLLFDYLCEAHHPKTVTEELTVLRLAQVHWTLRRLDRMEAAVYESHIQHGQQRHPTASPDALLATQFLDPKPSAVAHFTRRIQPMRTAADHRANRLTRFLHQLQQRTRTAESTIAAPTFAPNPELTATLTAAQRRHTRELHTLSFETRVSTATT